MNGWGMAALAVATVCAFNVGYLTTTVVAHRLHAKHVQRCHFCELHDAAPGSLWCSAVCADAELGTLGVTL